MISFEEARAAMGGTWSGDARPPARSLAGVSTDSRTARAGDVFIALKGPAFDGHDYLDTVAERAVAAAVVQRDVAAPAGLPLLRVADTLAALGALAAAVRAATHIPVVAITGSVGKTTTKEMTAALLETRGAVLKTQGNLNNHIGLPLTLLRLCAEHTAAVVEMGMSASGELARLTRVARPDVAVITNVAPVHLEFFSSLDEIARAKAEIFEGLGRQGVAVLNRDDPRLLAIGERLPHEVRWFGTGPGCHVSAGDWHGDAASIELDLIEGVERVRVHLPMPGTHTMRNFLAAAAVARHLGVGLGTIAVAAARMGAVDRRGRLLRLERDVLLIDDCYNANPVAVQAAASVLAANAARRRVAFLGDMLELGPSAPALHREVGEHVAPALDVLIGVGPLAAELVEGARRCSAVTLHHFADSLAAAEAAPELVRPGDAVLVKASRGVKAEAIVDALIAHFGVAQG
jgi:UDP-N-acetylmuramoyl-tripeptide--D-alanyl-D-alanine ligase